MEYASKLILLIYVISAIQADLNQARTVFHLKENNLRSVAVAKPNSSI